MKKLVFAAFILFSAIANAGSDLKLFATCTARVLEGELAVYLSSDRTRAEVVFSNVEKFPATVTNEAFVTVIDYVTDMGTDRILLATDGFNELHSVDAATGKARKVADLTCY